MADFVRNAKELPSDIKVAINEVLGDDITSSLQDRAKDQWNNEVGRRIAEYMLKNNLSKSNLNDLIIDAVKNNQLIIDEQTDSRANGTSEPVWHDPSQNWRGSSKPVDPNKIPDSLPEFAGCGADGSGTYNTAKSVTDWVRDAITFTPIAINLSGNGRIDLLSSTTASNKVFFDIDNDGFILTGYFNTAFYQQAINQ